MINLLQPTLLFWIIDCSQRAKKVVSDSPGLVDFAIGLVKSVLNLPDRQVKFFEEFILQKSCQNNLLIKTFGASWNDFWASKCWFQLARMASCKNDFAHCFGNKNLVIICQFYRLVHGQSWFWYPFEGRTIKRYQGQNLVSNRNRHSERPAQRI